MEPFQFKISITILSTVLYGFFVDFSNFLSKYDQELPVESLTACYERAEVITSQDNPVYTSMFFKCTYIKDGLCYMVKLPNYRLKTQFQ